MKPTYAFLLSLAIFSPGTARSQQFDLAGGYNYQNSDQGQGLRTHLNGWYASGQFDLNDHFALTLEADNYYGSVNSEDERQQNFVFGPQYIFLQEDRRTRPFLYVQAGDQRSSTNNEVEHAFNLQIGGGLQIKVSQRFSLQLTPAEYSFVKASSGPTHSFSAKVGISWTAWKKSRG
ncbi:outer membrane beta-barrel protein [Edaphobacter aggregans]|uniref:outer membrane beta-barrel protein n=1 Tax=Edaphobacter aggregans TaxID=570835 RepID=UPI000551E9C7|nr:outer membrane beta-barrel protein [Edaphobacter aggregans]